MAPRTEFGWLEILNLVRQDPDLAAINAHVEHRTEQDYEAPRTSRGGS
jgi:hypothetical protein